jgi:hypothetical protein
VEEAPVEAPADAPVAAEKPKKKSHKGLIITLIIVALVLIGGGVGFAVWAMIHESPEVALRDAFAGFWKEENIKVNGNLALEANGAKMSFDIDGAKSGKNITGSGSLNVNYAGQDMNVKYSASYIDEGKLFIKIDGLKDLYSSVDTDQMLGDSSLTGGMDYTSILSSALDAVVEKVDGNWYKISASEIKSYSSDAGCVLENFGSIFEKDSMDAIANAYGNNPFFELDKDAKVEEEDGVKYYTVKINKEKGVEFIKNAKSDSMKELRKCIDADNAKVSESSDDDKDTSIKIGVTPWTHKLAGIKMKGENNSELKWKVKYEKTDISEPSDYKTIDELMQDLQEAITTGMTAFLKTICESTYGEYGEAYVNMCIESAADSMDDFDLSTIFQQFGGGSDEPTIEDCTDADETDC